MDRKTNKENALSSATRRPTTLGSTVRALTLACATLTTGLVAGVYYAFAVSVNLGLAPQPDASYRSLPARGALPAAPLGPLLAGRFGLGLYIGGSFLLTSFVSVPMNNQLAAVDLDAPARVLADARDAYEGPWEFWNGVRAVFSVLAFLALIGACLLREDRRQPGGRT